MPKAVRHVHGEIDIVWNRVSDALDILVDVALGIAGGYVNAFDPAPATQGLFEPRPAIVRRLPRADGQYAIGAVLVRQQFEQSRRSERRLHLALTEAVAHYARIRPEYRQQEMFSRHERHGRQRQGPDGTCSG